MTTNLYEAPTVVMTTFRTENILNTSPIQPGAPVLPDQEFPD